MKYSQACPTTSAIENTPDYFCYWLIISVDIILLFSSTLNYFLLLLVYSLYTVMKLYNFFVKLKWLNTWCFKLFGMLLILRIVPLVFLEYFATNVFFLDCQHQNCHGIPLLLPYMHSAEMSFSLLSMIPFIQSLIFTKIIPIKSLVFDSDCIDLFGLFQIAPQNMGYASFPFEI